VGCWEGKAVVRTSVVSTVPYSVLCTVINRWHWEFVLWMKMRYCKERLPLHTALTTT